MFSNRAALSGSWSGLAIKQSNMTLKPVPPTTEISTSFRDVDDC